MLSAQNIVGASQCFEQWHYATCHNYSITDYRRTGQGAFRGHISARSFGALTVSKLETFASESRIEVIRSPAEIRGDPRDYFMLLLVCCGEVGFAQNGRTARLQNGDMLIYDQARPFTLEFGADTRQIIVTIPRPLMASRLPEAERFTASRIASGSKLGALTATVVRQLVQFETSLNEDVANRVGASALDILATTLEAELSEDAEGEGRHHARLTRVKRYVAANLHDAEMTIESIAAAQNLAPRTLHRLLAPYPCQFGVRVSHVTGNRIVEGTEILQVVEKLFHTYPSVPSFLFRRFAASDAKRCNTGAGRTRATSAIARWPTVNGHAPPRIDP